MIHYLLLSVDQTDSGAVEDSMERPVYRGEIDNLTELLFHLYSMESYIDSLEAQVASYIDAESGYTHRIDELEKQILARDEKIIIKNKEIHISNYALARLMKFVTEEGLCINQTGLLKSKEYCEKHANCYACYSDALRRRIK